ncbi:MAG: PD-(D/E)XK nuclease family protein [Massilia sp.]|uniref:PD-(D/E)XK nuclease family protein n=1 Tax=Massilia sp. TaxID=1882437 RepID=UPI002FCC7968
MQQDADDFRAVLDGCAGQVVLSYSRRRGDGRSLGKSPLLAVCPAPQFVRRYAAAAHAMSETDRLAARPAEFRDCATAATAHGCWRNWQVEMVTAHDGAVQPGHQRLLAVAARTHSASSLKRLLRNPLGYLWEYGLGWKAPGRNAEPLTLYAAAAGNLVHEILGRALRTLAPDGGLARAGNQAIDAAVGSARATAGGAWANGIDLPRP